MQTARPKLRTLARRAVAGIATAPMMAALAIASIAMTLVVALGTVNDGRLPATGSVGLVCALVLAAVAVAEASRPARSERLRRRTAPSPRSHEQVSDADASIVTRWN